MQTNKNNKEPGFMANWSSTSGLGGVPEIEVYVAGAENFTAGSIHRVPRYRIAGNIGDL